MTQLFLVEPDEVIRQTIVARLRDGGHDVLEADEEQAMTMFRDGIETVVVWSARDAARAAKLLDRLRSDTRRPILLLSPSARDSGISAAHHRPELVGDSTAMRDLRATVRRLARRPRTHLLVAGEPGTGKQTLTRVLHRNTQETESFVHASPDRLAALLDAGLTELSARGGTLYVPAIADVPKNEQRRLSAKLAEYEARGHAPLRLIVGIALTSPDLPLAGHVREALCPELAARLPVVLELLPLRRRKSDIPMLVDHFLSEWAKSSSLPPPEITPGALEKLAAHDWPGNLRELGNVIEDAALRADAVIDVTDLPSFEPRRSGIDYQLPCEGVDLSELERAILAQALRRAGGNQTRAASLLGLTRDQIRYRMGKFGILRS